MLLDFISVAGCAVLACLFVLHRNGTLRVVGLHPENIWIVVVMIVVYAFCILSTCQEFQLYAPERPTSIFREQLQTLQACVMSSLLLASALSVLYPRDLQTAIVLTTVCLTTVTLGTRRLVSRLLLYGNCQDGAFARNVFIVGTDATAQALRVHLDSMRHLGYAFKGFIDNSHSNPGATNRDVIGTLETLFEQVRKHFIDEIFFTTSCDQEDVEQVLQDSRFHDVNIRLVPHLYGTVIVNPTIECMGHLLTIPLRRRRMPESRLFVKRAFDIAISVVVLLAGLPVFLAIAIAIKVDSQGPVFYASERLGKKGRLFRCFKFRTMVRNAEGLRWALTARNQRDGILFKVENDPRITRVGRFLRKYSLDELPQFVNVLIGEMSLVGPRPPLASEVMQYKTRHLRRLNVMPGITGLWQVQARNDPSFDKYVSLDMQYIENWSILLDLEIMLRTVGVVFSGTGS